MAQYMKEYHPDLKRGDAFLHNSPFHGNGHAADHAVLVPVIDDDGIHRLTLVIKAHQADCGNSLPTTLHATARDLFEEGALLFPCVKLQSDYEFVDDVVRMCKLRIRLPDQFFGDLMASVGSARIGEREFLALGEEIGWDRLETYAEQWFDYSESMMVEEIRSMTPGTAKVVSFHDHFPGTPEEGIRIVAEVRIDSEEEMIHVDLTECPDNMPCGLNLTEATTRTAAMIGIFNSIDPRVPASAGSFRRINITLREGAIAGIPAYPYSTSVATTNVADHVSNSVQRAIAEISSNNGMGETGYAFTPATASVSGIDPRNGKPFVNMMFLGHTAGAGNCHGDAWMTMLHAGNGGLCQIDSTELSELYHPIEIDQRRLEVDTEGAGRHRGAPALRIEYGPIEGAQLDIVYASDGVQHPAKGAQGGGSPMPANQFLRHADGSLEDLPSVHRLILEPGQIIVGVAQGGGGFGDPKERAPQRVVEDVREGYISQERARSVYGVAVNQDFELDKEVTAQLRD
jgi:N-methylhydantoinase B